MTNIRHAVERMLQRMIDQPGAHRITGYVEQGPQVLKDGSNDLALETVIKNMTFITHYFIVPEGKNTQYPLHYSGNIFITKHFEDKVRMISHQAEADQKEFIFFLGFFNDFQEQTLKTLIEDLFLTVDLCGYMVCGVRLFKSGPAHEGQYIQFPCQAGLIRDIFLLILRPHYIQMTEKIMSGPTDHPLP
jgi:hypothetical protein